MNVNINRLYSRESFCKRMIVSGIVGPMLALGFGLLFTGSGQESRILNIAITIFVPLFFYCLAVLAGTYYWKTSLNLLIKGAMFLIDGIFNFFGSIAVVSMGIVFFPIKLLYLMLGFIACILGALAPFIFIPFGGILLESLIIPEESSTITTAIIVVLCLLNVASVVFFNFVKPIQQLKGGPMRDKQNTIGQSVKDIVTAPEVQEEEL